MAEETHYTPQTGAVSISTANGKLDGTGALATLITGASPGTLIKSIYIKAGGNTTQGMIRFFIHFGGNSRLLFEVEVDEIDATGNNPTFEKRVDLYFTLKEGHTLQVATEKAETFYVVAEANNWSYFASSVRSDTTQITVAMGRSNVTTANPNRDGTGTLATILTAGSSGTYNGASLRTITIKSQVNTNSGMIRFYVDDLSNKYLFMEVPVKTLTKSAIDESYERTIIFPDDFDLQANYRILVSTENSETMSVICEAYNFNYLT